MEDESYFKHLSKRINSILTAPVHFYHGKGPERHNDKIVLLASLQTYVIDEMANRIRVYTQKRFCNITVVLVVV